MFEIIHKFFVQGLSPTAIFIITATVTYIFVITFIVCLIDKGVRKAKKTFFAWLCVLAAMLSAACYALDFLSAKTFPLFQAVVWFAGQCTLMLIEYGALAVQSVMFVGDKVIRNESVADGKGLPAYGSAMVKNAITPIKHAKTGAVKEIPLSKPTLVKMETPKGSDCLGERYVKDCIERLKAVNLTVEDAAALSKIERGLTPPIACGTAEEKLQVSKASGELIALMAKYF